MASPPASPPILPLIVSVSIGGAVGAVARFLLSRFAAERFPDHAWLGTLAANLIGCFLIGVGMYAAADLGRLSPTWRALLVTGFLGGLTTFSTFGHEAVALSRGEGWPLAAVHLAANVLGGLTLVWLGRKTGELLLT
ncbi:MAG: fluoride efflux transporter CrcB [Planctomycetota bacterium]